VKTHKTTPGRVTIGFGYDSWFLPEEYGVPIFRRMIRAGVTTVTSHIDRKAFQDMGAPVTAIKDYGVLNMPKRLVLSHDLPGSEQAMIKRSSSNVFVSVTPETEAQIDMHRSCSFDIALEPSQIGLGVDCHASNTSFLPLLARTALYSARIQTNEELAKGNKWPENLIGNTLAAFNMMAINGQRA
jgi:cytosine/adenosine deaminase-related metal-dependent hydrolase